MLVYSLKIDFCKRLISYYLIQGRSRNFTQLFSDYQFMGSFKRPV